MPTITCPHNGAEKTLGPHQLISAHRSRAGVVSYYRCHCGDLVLDTPRGIRHSRPNTTPDAHRGGTPRMARNTRFVADYLSAFSIDADREDWGPGARMALHDFVSTLVKATASEVDHVSVVVPPPTDPPVTLMRALARLAEQTAGQKVPVCPALADRLDELNRELASAHGG